MNPKLYRKYFNYISKIGKINCGFFKCPIIYFNMYKHNLDACTFQIYKVRNDFMNIYSKSMK